MCRVFGILSNPFWHKAGQPFQLENRFIRVQRATILPPYFQYQTKSNFTGLEKL
jgi:hypothetical protein